MLMLDFIVPVSGNENRASRCSCGVCVCVPQMEIFSAKVDSLKGRTSHSAVRYVAMCCCEGEKIPIAFHFLSSIMLRRLDNKSCEKE